MYKLQGTRARAEIDMAIKNLAPDTRYPAPNSAASAPSPPLPLSLSRPLFLILALVLLLLAPTAEAQRTRRSRSSRVASAKASEAPDPRQLNLPLKENAGKSRVTFVNGLSFEVDDVWQDANGVSFRQGAITKVVEPATIARIMREPIPAKTEPVKAESAKAEPAKGEQVKTETPAAAKSTPAAKVVATAANAPKKETVWILLVGGARMQVDDVNESKDGAWYKRGQLSVFIDRSRIQRIERQNPADAIADNAPWVARGWTTGNTGLDDLIRSNGTRYGVDPYLIFCVMEQESHFHPRAVSPKGARGLMQLMPGTGARFGVRRFFDPVENIAGGTQYLKELLQSFGGKVELVLASYNAGEGAVVKYGRTVPPYRETRDYVKRISARYGRSAHPVDRKP
jgi:cell division septation protein DedD